ncbi:hypothetical protein KEJ21_03985 [Candidatus Bathyarchaeota archaeon]|nr:hypothetical protein [Candidatus Bathyarchaeota archaeon]MBS7631790.1 hypothetical protein [Candidatus Bathyarchaeota archaeon]
MYNLEKEAPLINMDELSWEVAKSFSRKEEIRIEQNEEETSWYLKHALDPKYKQLFDSYKLALRYRANFYHSLKRLEERGLIKLHKETMFRGKRPRIAHVILTNEGKNYIKEKLVS